MYKVREREDRVNDMIKFGRKTTKKSQGVIRDDVRVKIQKNFDFFITLSIDIFSLLFRFFFFFFLLNVHFAVHVFF